MDLDLKIPCHMDGSMSGYFLMMDDMSPDGLWDCDEESMEDGHYGDGSRPEMDCGRRWMTRDGSRPEMDRGRKWITTGYGWMTGGG